MLSEITRSGIMEVLEDGYKSSEFVYYGILNEIKFFKRIYQLTELPSTDKRFAHAERDIYQHLVANEDWEWNWFYDSYNDNFDLVANDQKFLIFLAEIFHPTVRGSKSDNSHNYLDKINRLLEVDGYNLTTMENISGKSIYGWVEVRKDIVLGKSIAQLKEDFNSSYINKQIDLMVDMAEQHPNLAIGKAKELLESCTKTILNYLKIDFDPKMDLTPLVKKTYKALKLDPTSIDKDSKHHQTAIRILGSLSAITQYMAELRNEYGDGHGKDRDFRNLPPHYAHLAIGTATTVVRFMWDTHNINKGFSKTN